MIMVRETFKQTCRTCLSTNGEMVHIFSSVSYVNQLPKKLMAFIEVEISDNDDLPKMICKKCMFLADSFYCFKQQCEFADNRLKSLIKKSLINGDNFPINKEENTNSNNDKNRKTDLQLITNFKNKNSDYENPKKEAKKCTQECPETEGSYIIDYISDEVRIQVENASKRRQEAERRISMEKVSQSIKNLKGIEVLPIGEVCASRIERNGRIQQQREEIVVFPVKLPKKRCKVIETIVIDDPPPPLNKRLKLSPETTVSKIKEGRSNSDLVYGKYKKLNFSTVRKVVKIDNEELRVEPKQENVRESDKENCRIKYDNDFVVGRDDNDKQNPQFQYSEIQEFYSEKQEPDVIEDKLREDSKDEEKNFKTQLLQILDFSTVPNKNAVYDNEDKKHDPSPDNEKPCTYFPSRMKEPVEIFASSESNELQKSKVADNFECNDTVAKSTIGCIINGIYGHNFDDMEDLATFQTSDSPRSLIHCRTDKSNEFFIENDASNASDDWATAHGDETVKSISSYTKSCFEARNIDEKKAKENLRSNSIQFNSEQVTPLALLSVNSSGEENSAINLKIYKRDDDPITDQIPRNSNLKFYQCTICSINFVSMPAVLRHNIQEHMGDEAPCFCLICDKSFKDKPALFEHVEEHNGSKPYRCNFCPKTFTLKRNLKRHVNHHINYKPFQCHVCMKRFTEKSSLKSHMYLHTGDSPFACKSCNVSFNNKTNWRRHVMTIHEKLTVVACKYCNKELPDKRSLQVHTRVHTGHRPYQCPHCDKRFTQQCNLNTHIHCHLNDRPFGCPHCGKGFNQRGTRDDHILTHTGEKRHKCMECGASFTVSSALKRHMWIHTDKDRPHNCKNCKLQFVGLYDLRRHLKIRHGEVVKLENPRVERVLADDDQNNKEAAEGWNIVGQSELDFNETGGMDSVRYSKVAECSKVKITAKENSSLSCNVDKIEDVQPEEMKEGFSQTKFENFNNRAKNEIVDDSEMSKTGDDGAQISCPDNNGH